VIEKILSDAVASCEAFDDRPDAVLFPEEAAVILVSSCQPIPFARSTLTTNWCQVVQFEDLGKLLFPAHRSVVSPCLVDTVSKNWYKDSRSASVSRTGSLSKGLVSPWCPAEGLAQTHP
jgi:hypothetical protein